MEPVDGQRQAAQSRPHVVAVPVVTQLMGQDMPELCLRLAGGLGRQIDGGTEQSEQTGRNRRFRYIHGKRTAGGVKRRPGPAEPLGEPQVGHQKAAQRQPHTGQPREQQAVRL